MLQGYRSHWIPTPILRSYKEVLSVSRALLRLTKDFVVRNEDQTEKSRSFLRYHALYSILIITDIKTNHISLFFRTDHGRGRCRIKLSWKCM